uniref:GTPase EngC n=1 Tax=mine drainage metagenome TaxID=410659 RepID=E6PDZ5_9ZZZZ
MRVSESLAALVVSVGRNSAWVALEGEPGIRLAQIRRSSGARSMPVPGDRVLVSPLEDAIVVIDAIEPRERLLARRTVAGREKALAANVELLVTVTSLAAPPPRTIVLDQLLVYAHFEEIAALVVFTKADLAESPSALPALYSSLGYRCLSIDAKHGGGIDAFRSALEGSRSLLVGVSGVGKSSIFRWMGGENEIGDLSRFGLGRQTTTAARLVRLDPGFLIDSPGVADFGLGKVTPSELAPAFPEFVAAGRCRFADCSHRTEPDCAIRSGVARGEIAASRYESYTRFLSEG